MFCFPQNSDTMKLFLIQTLWKLALFQAVFLRSKKRWKSPIRDKTLAANLKQTVPPFQTGRPGGKHGLIPGEDGSKSTPKWSCLTLLLTFVDGLSLWRQKNVRKPTKINHFFQRDAKQACFLIRPKAETVVCWLYRFFVFKWLRAHSANLAHQLNTSIAEKCALLPTPFLPRRRCRPLPAPQKAAFSRFLLKERSDIKITKFTRWRHLRDGVCR